MNEIYRDKLKIELFFEIMKIRNYYNEVRELFNCFTIVKMTVMCILKHFKLIFISQNVRLLQFCYFIFLFVV